MAITMGKMAKIDKYFIEGVYEDIKGLADILKSGKFQSIFHKEFTDFLLCSDGKWKIIFDRHCTLLWTIVDLCEEIRLLGKQLESEARTTYYVLLEKNLMEQEIKYLIKSIMYLQKSHKAETSEERKKAHLFYRRNIRLLRRLTHNNPEFIDKKRSDIYDKL